MSQSVVAQTGDGMWWIVCDDGIHWVPLEVKHRQELVHKIFATSVFKEYLFKQPGTIFYGPPPVPSAGPVWE